MIPLLKVFMPEFENSELIDVLYSGKLTSGELTSRFEKTIGEYIGNPRVLVTSTPGYALQIAFDLLMLPAGSEVIVSPMSCLASTQPILTSNLQIVWADIDPQTGTLDPYAVEKSISSKTKAIFHYHWCGYPGYIDEINSIAKEHGLYVIEDATESFGARYDSKFIGNNGSDIVCFNFGPVRLPTTIDGGALTFNSMELYEKAKVLRDLGIDRSQFRDCNGEISTSYDVSSHGYSATMSNFNAYIGLRQMEYVPTLLKAQKSNAHHLSKILIRNTAISMLKILPQAEPSYWVYSVLAPNKNQMLSDANKKGVTFSSVHIRNDKYSCFKDARRSALPGVDEFARMHLAMPSGWWIGEHDRGLLGDLVTGVSANGS